MRLILGCLVTAAQVLPLSSFAYSLRSSSRSAGVSFRRMSHSATSTKGEGAAAKALELGLYRSTPLIQSSPLTELCKRPVYLKLDLLQTSGSFKDRGMAHLCTTLMDQGVTKVISSSGGNAGLAVSTVATQLKMEVQVVVPETTKPLVIEKLQSLGVDVTVYGANWNAADLLARERVDADPSASYVSPYENPLLWTGHSTLVDEVIADLGGDEPFTLVASVGGGGLLCGMLEGLDRHGAFNGAVVAAETAGAASFDKAWEKGELVRLDGIHSIATSLGALEVTPASLEQANAYEEKGGTFDTAVCTDAEAVDACWRFAADHRMLVEPACGAALAVAYTERLRNALPTKGPLVLEVCGGNGVNVDLLTQWRKDYPI